MYRELIDNFYQQFPVVTLNRASTGAQRQTSSTSENSSSISKHPIWSEFKDACVPIGHQFTATCLHFAQTFKCIRPNKANLLI